MQIDPAGGRPPRRRRRVLTWTLFFAALLAVMLIRLPRDGHHWSWPLFIWGAVIGLLAVPANMVITRMALRALPLSEQTHASVLTRVRARERSLYTPLVALSLCFATYAAARDSAWPVVLETLAFVLAVGLPLWLLPKLRRRAAGRMQRRGY